MTGSTAVIFFPGVIVLLRFFQPEFLTPPIAEAGTRFP